MKLDKRGRSSYEKLFRIHFTAIAVIDLLLFAFLTKDPRHLWSGLALWFYFPPTQGLLLFRLVVRLKHQFPEIYPKINKRFASTI